LLFLSSLALAQDVVWMAPFFSRSGYGSEALNFVLALSERVPGLQIQQHGDSIDERTWKGYSYKVQEKLMQMMIKTGKTLVSICHSEPGAWYPSRWEQTKCPRPGTLFSIGRTMFETDRLPEGWEARCNKMDQIWVPTQFQKEIFIKEGIKSSKLVVIGEAIDTDFYNPELYTPLPLPQQDEIQFKFLSIFKWENRKGWQILLRAFINAFTKDSSVGLYILTQHYHDKQDHQQIIQGIIAEEVGANRVTEGNVPPIIVLTEHIPNTELPRLYKACDAFVLPSRGEGWGRPHVEAMSMGLPIIATFWSGPTEYMTEENSYPLKITGLVPVGEGPFASHMWAEPDQQRLIELMQHVHKHPEEAKQKGVNARQDMVSKYHPSILANIIFDQLQHVSEIVAERKEHIDL